MKKINRKSQVAKKFNPITVGHNIGPWNNKFGGRYAFDRRDWLAHSKANPCNWDEEL